MSDHLDEQTIYAYLDGELPAGDQAALQAHLADCGECRLQVDAVKQLFQRISALPDQPLGVDLASRVLESVRQAPIWLPRLAIGQLLAALAGGAALLLGLGSTAVSQRLTEVARGVVLDLEATLSSVLTATANALPDPAAFQFELGLPAIWSIAVVAAVFLALSNGLMLRRMSRRD